MPPNLQVHKLSPALLLEGENALEDVSRPIYPSVTFDASLRPCPVEVSVRKRESKREREREREFQEIHLDRMNGALGFRPMASSPRYVL